MTAAEELAKCVREYLLDSMTSGTRALLREHVLSLVARFDREAPVRACERELLSIAEASCEHDMRYVDCDTAGAVEAWHDIEEQHEGRLSAAYDKLLAARAAAGKGEGGEAK